MHKQDKTALQVLISFAESCLTNPAGELDKDKIAELNTLLVLCKEQGTKGEEEWLTEIAQAVFEFCKKAPISLAGAWKEGIKG